VDVGKLSDEYATPLGFTGAFVGMSSIDVADGSSYADFKRFAYKPYY
jgi:xylan 1,4-beta-xylosidase